MEAFLQVPFFIDFQAFGYHFGSDLGRILHQMGVFLHLKNYSDFGAHFREPQENSRGLGNHTTDSRRTLPAPKGKVPVTWKVQIQVQVQVPGVWQGRCRC